MSQVPLPRQALTASNGCTHTKGGTQQSGSLRKRLFLIILYQWLAGAEEKREHILQRGCLRTTPNLDNAPGDSLPQTGWDSTGYGWGRRCHALCCVRRGAAPTSPGNIGWLRRPGSLTHTASCHQRRTVSPLLSMMCKDKYITCFILHLYFITYSVWSAEVLNPSNKLKIQNYICQDTERRWGVIVKQMRHQFSRKAT